MKRARVMTDVVYTLWTRDGREVETKRVQLEGVPSAPFYARVTLVPKRSTWLKWDEDSNERMRFAGLDEKKLFGETADASAAAFLFPFGERKVWFSAQLDESDPSLKQGIELSNKDDFEGAFASFEAVAKGAPTFAGAVYNMGVMREVQGRDEEALALYKKALELGGDSGMYGRALKALEDRMSHRSVLVLP